MFSIGRLISLLVPSSILGLSYFWWRWKRKSAECANQIDFEVSNEENSGEKVETTNTFPDTVEDVSVHVQCEFEIHHHTQQLLSQVNSVENDYQNVALSSIREPVEDEILEEVLLPLECSPFNSEESQQGLLKRQIMCDDLSVIDVGVQSANSSQTSFTEICNNINEMTNSQASYPDDNPTCSDRKRLFSRSSCGDSAYGDGYSSDTLSTTGYDSAVKSSECEFSTPRKCKNAKDEIDSNGQDSSRTYRDWYSSGLIASSIKEKPDSNRHWGSIPVSDSESEGDCILKCTAKVGCMTLDELNKQLNEELAIVKSQRENISNSPRRRPRQNRRRERKKPDSCTDAAKASPKKTAKVKESKKAQKKKEKNACSKKDVDNSSWRAESSTNDENMLPVGEREVIEYEFPDDLCGRLIGKSGRHISELKKATDVDICIEGELHGKNRIVSMTGVRSQIKKAEKILNEKFHDTLKLVIYPDMEMTISNLLPITLIENKEYDVIVTAVVDVGNFYIQIFDTAVDEGLTELQIDLAGIYTTPRPKYIYHADDPPRVDEYCVTFVDNTWCRLKVNLVFPDTQTVEAFFIDYGGSVTLSFSRIWKIRSDMLVLKPQAVLCDLHGIFPLEGNDAQFSFVANDIFYQIIGGNMLKALVVSVHDEIPSIKLWYYSEEKNEFMSVGEQMHTWGLIMDTSLIKLHEASGESSNELVEDSNEEENCFLRHSTSLTSTHDCATQSFICAN